MGKPKKGKESLMGKINNLRFAMDGWIQVDLDFRLEVWKGWERKSRYAESVRDVGSPMVMM